MKYSSNYSALAPIYDKVMVHVAYDKWVFMIKKIIKKYFGKSQLAILELGAGTGNLAKHLEDLNCTYFGSDISYPMCQNARSKKLTFFCADALNLPLKSEFDIVLFLYDGINYLKSLQDYKTLFQQVEAILKNKCGMFLFDITTETNSVNNFEDIMEYEEYEKSTYLRHSFYDRFDKIQYNEFLIFHEANDSFMFMKHKEIHSQKIFSVKEIKSVIPSCFSVEGIWDGYTMKEWHPLSERIHFLLKKDVK